MGYTFDIFKKLGDGKSIWITAVQGLEEARKRASRLASIAPGEYFIFSQRRGVVEYLNQGIYA